MLVGTPFEDFKQEWIENLSMETIGWAEGIGVWSKDKKETDRFNGVRAPNAEDKKSIEKLFYAIKHSTNYANTMIVIAKHTGEAQKSYRKNTVTIIAWMHEMVREHYGKPNMIKCLEAVISYL